MAKEEWDVGDPDGDGGESFYDQTFPDEPADPPIERKEED